MSKILSLFSYNVVIIFLLHKLLLSSIFPQAACLSICQYLTACHDQLEDETDESDSESEQAPPPYQPPPEAAPVVVKQKSKKPKRQVSEPPSQVKQIIEMGFQRKHVEYAIKALGRLGINYSRLVISNSKGLSEIYFEISVHRHIRFAEFRKK